MTRQEIISLNRSRRLKHLPLLQVPPKIYSIKYHAFDGQRTYQGCFKTFDAVQEYLLENHGHTFKEIKEEVRNA